MDTAKSIERELIPGASNLYIFFGGLAAGIAMPPFEFYNAAKIVNENKIFIRDFGQCWYHSGLPGISHDIQSTADYLHGEIQKLNPEKVFFAGNSMGGYAAILFSTLTRCGQAIAFAPQTFISPLLRLRHGDIRWPIQIANTYVRSVLKKKYWDLKPFLLDTKAERKISIFVAKDHRLDYIHARHLDCISSVNIYEFESGGHGVVKLLRDEGKLSAIMLDMYY